MIVDVEYFIQAVPVNKGDRHMARKKRMPAQALSLPLSKGEIWEVGRRALDVPVADLDRKGVRPEVLLVVQAGDEGSIVLGDAITSSAPLASLVDIVIRAMRKPLIGKPRRPEVIRVGSPVEAELLATAPAMTGVALEVAGQLDALARLHAHMELQLSGLSSDYRTQATRAGETLSTEGLQAFFRTARQFYRKAMWEAYGDEEVFELTLQTAQGASKTLYGIIIGALGQEFGLALYPSLEALQQFYDVSLEHLDQFPDLGQPITQQRPESAQWQSEAEAMADLLQVSTLCLTYTPQLDVPPPLVAEAKQCKLPVANKSAFPLVMRTGQGGMRAATALELADMYAAMSAIMDWDKRMDEVESEDEVGIILTSQIPAVPGFLQALTVHTTLRENPCLPEEDEDDTDGWLPDLSTLFESFLREPPRRKPAPQKKAASGQKSPAPGKTTPAPPTDTNEERGKGQYPRIVKKEGKTRPQYLKDDADT
jgi:hypothetical protein